MAVLVTGERRRLELPAHTGTVANALDRLDDWIATIDGGWVNKQHIVEVRPVRVLDEDDPGAPGDHVPASPDSLASGDRAG